MKGGDDIKTRRNMTKVRMNKWGWHQSWKEEDKGQDEQGG
jgi:hypothetical protein